MVSPGADAESSRKAVGVAEEFPEVFAAVGVSPHDAKDAVEEDFERLVALYGSMKHLQTMGKA